MQNEHKEEEKETAAEATEIARDEEYWANYDPHDSCQNPYSFD